VTVGLIWHSGQCLQSSKGALTQCETIPLDKSGRLCGASGAPVGQGIRTTAFAEETVVYESQRVMTPKKLDFEQALLLAYGIINGLGAVTNTAKVSVGSRVLVIGASGVGLNSIQGWAVRCASGYCSGSFGRTTASG
jgi:Zn-dependent alcohol dehydrogenase